jgi:hypothetical protein
VISFAPFRQGVGSIRRVLVASKQAESKETLLGFLAKGGSSYLSFLDFNCKGKAMQVDKKETYKKLENVESIAIMSR